MLFLEAVLSFSTTDAKGMFKCLFIRQQVPLHLLKKKEKKIIKEELALKMSFNLFGRHGVRVDPSDKAVVTQCSHDPLAVSLINNETDVLWSIECHSTWGNCVCKMNIVVSSLRFIS